jgi:hypothetical protein
VREGGREKKRESQRKGEKGRERERKGWGGERESKREREEIRGRG